ncbi:MAG: RNA polymerase sigma factor [Bacteroidota bacterium]
MSLQEKIETPIVPLPSAWAGLGDSELLTYFLEPATRDRAFREILNRYQKRVYYHVRRIVIDHDDAADVVQNTFVKVLVSLEGFRSHSLLFTWIYRIATNEAITFLKKKRTRYFIPLVDVESELSSKLDSDPLFNADKMERHLQKAILKLPQKQRLVFNMRYYDELSYEDISKIVGTSVGALKASYHHAYKKIEKYLKEV